MDFNNFEKLMLQARHFDKGIERLSNIWSRPDILIGRFGERSEETNAHIEELWNSIQTTQKGIETTTLELDKCTEDSSAEHTLQETRREYELLKEQCDNIELIFEKYGYQYDKDNSLDQEISNSTNTSLEETFEEARKSVEVEFTPNLSWKCKAKQKEQSTSESNISDTSNLITTPVRENSISDVKNVILCKDYLSMTKIRTPIRERPEEPMYSKHFYNSLKK